ncbi:MAG TPA: CBS domain-containing protein [Candidatus Micrarchaeia archaeon]|nr:CBS domain-containing protein [Candidatus Micrarchaeia archaeon]
MTDVSPGGGRDAAGGRPRSGGPPLDRLAGALVSATAVVRAALLDREGQPLGRVRDVIARIAEGTYPPITGLRARIGQRELFLPIDQIGSLAPFRVQFSGDSVRLGRFERRPGEVLLDEDVIGRRLIDVRMGKLIHANDVALAAVGGRWRMVAVDPTKLSALHRVIPWRSRSGMVSPRRLVDWSDVEAFTGHVPGPQLPIPLRRLRRLHPAQIADLIEHASHEEGTEIIDAVGDDPDFEADVFEELDEEHQRHYFEERSDEEAAELLAEMAADDAADLIAKVDQDRRVAILQLLPPAQQTTLRHLLNYNPDTAGGMMTTQGVIVDQGATVDGALQAVREADDLPPQAGSVVVLVDADRRLVSTVPLADLVRAPGDQAAATLPAAVSARLHASSDVPAIALLMSDYNATALPVVDDEDRFLGLLTVDDLLEAMVPPDWRRRQRGEADG